MKKWKSLSEQEKAAYANRSRQKKEDKIKAVKEIFKIRRLDSSEQNVIAPKNLQSKENVFKI